VAPDFDLQRFVAAQDRSGVYAQALRELRAGRKQSHWMWFVFPQVAGLGHSSMARIYALSGLDEARAYLAHPVLGPRLVECSTALLDLGGRDPVTVFGGIDAQKLRSSMTLFEAAAGDEQPVFGSVLDHYFAGERDEATTSRI
jgi:uncharacterized protein (DUF1810 family)